MTSEEYRRKIKEQYYTRRTDVLVSKKEIATVAEIRNALNKILDRKLSSMDNLIIQRYFNLSKNETLTEFLIEKKLSTYIAIPRFLKEEIGSTNMEAIDLLALLIDFKPRPFDYKLLTKDANQFIPENHLQYDILLKKLAANFTGREFVFKKINDFIKANSSGYYYIIGNPGIGKSALAAKYATDNNTLLHFINYQKSGSNKVGYFISNICTQIKKRLDLSIDTFPIDYDKDGGFLESVLLKASQGLSKDQKLIITIDGIDELDNLTLWRNRNIINLPEVLPKGIFFLLTMRDIEDDIQLPYNEGESDSYKIEHDSLENETDIMSYIEKQLENEKVQEYLKKYEINTKEFKEEFKDKAEGNFMYLVNVFPEIEEGIYQNTELKDLPKGLNNYYKDHLERMMKDVSALEEEVKLKTIYVLSDMKSPVSTKTLANIIKSNVKDANIITVQKALEEWSQFLNTSYKDDEKKYSLYHKSFADFLKEKEMIKIAGFNYDDVNEMVLKHMMGDFFEDEEDEDDDIEW